MGFLDCMGIARVLRTVLDCVSIWFALARRRDWMWPSGPMVYRPWEVYTERVRSHIWRSKGRQSWNSCGTGELKRRGTLVWFYIPRPFGACIAHGCWDCTRIAIGLWIAACARFVFVGAALWYLKLGLYGYRKSTVFERLALVEL